MHSEVRLRWTIDLHMSRYVPHDTRTALTRNFRGRMCGMSAIPINLPLSSSCKCQNSLHPSSIRYWQIQVINPSKRFFALTRPRPHQAAWSGNASLRNSVFQIESSYWQFCFLLFHETSSQIQKPKYFVIELQLDDLIHCIGLSVLGADTSLPVPSKKNRALNV